MSRERRFCSSSPRVGACLPPTEHGGTVLIAQSRHRSGRREHLRGAGGAPLSQARAVKNVLTLQLRIQRLEVRIVVAMDLQASNGTRSKRHH